MGSDGSDGSDVENVVVSVSTVLESFLLGELTARDHNFL